MEKERTSLEQKLILLVLIGILGCLVVIIAQNFGRKPAVEPAAITEQAEAAPVEAAESVPPEPASLAKHLLPPRANPVAVVRESESSISSEFRNSSRSDVTVVNPSPVSVIVRDPPRRAPTALTPIGTTRGGKSVVLSGRVTFKGKAPPEKQINFGAAASTCGALNPQGATTRHYLVSPKGGFANVLVYVKTGLESYTFPVPKEPVVIDATACFYEPYMSVAQVGQKVFFRNLDPFMHNIHVTAKNNPEFNFALPVQGMIQERTFDKPEIFVRIKDDVYDWMFAYLAVLPHPFAAVSDEEGNYKFPAALPPGEYTIAAQHLKAGDYTHVTSLGSAELQTLNFTFQDTKH